MRRTIYSAAGLTAALATGGCGLLHQDSLKQASDASGGNTLKAIEFSGTGRWFQFGQAPNPDLPWPPFAVKSYTAHIDFDTASARVQIARSQVVEPGRNRPAPVEQKADQYISGNAAWNVAPPAANAQAPSVSAQPAAVEERTAEIWASQQGFLKAALAHQAKAEASGDGEQISFKLDNKHRYVGKLNAKHQLVNVQTWIDNPVLGDTLVETRYSDYRDFGGIQFPAHIERSQGGFPVLDINVNSVKANPVINIAVPAEASKPAAVTVTCTKLADGVFYLTGGSHHSVAIEQKDHIVLVESPLNEERSLALIAKKTTSCWSNRR